MNTEQSYEKVFIGNVYNMQNIPVYLCLYIVNIIYIIYTWNNEHLNIMMDAIRKEENPMDYSNLKNCNYLLGNRKTD